MESLCYIPFLTIICLQFTYFFLHKLSDINGNIICMSLRIFQWWRLSGPLLFNHFLCPNLQQLSIAHSGLLWCLLYSYAYVLSLIHILLLVEAKSRSVLERNASLACDMIFDWCEDNKLKLSVAKTKTMLVKRERAYKRAGRRAHAQRPPTIKMKGESVGYVKELSLIHI